jgi:hypothetical protein
MPTPTEIRDQDAIPTLKKPFVIIIFNSLGVLGNSYNAVAGELLPFYVDLGLVGASGWGVWAGTKLYEKAIEQRKQWRKQKYEAWLAAPVPVVEQETNWAEIERAMGELLKKEIEPTYERAKDFLASEKTLTERADREKRRSRLMKQRSKSCKHTHVEVSWVSAYRVLHTCRDCGENLLDETFDAPQEETYTVDQSRQEIVRSYSVPPHIMGKDKGISYLIDYVTEYEQPPPDQVAKCPRCAQWHRPSRACAVNPFKRRGRFPL